MKKPETVAFTPNIVVRNVMPSLLNNNTYICTKKLVKYLGVKLDFKLNLKRVGLLTLSLDIHSCHNTHTNVWCPPLVDCIIKSSTAEWVD